MWTVPEEVSYVKLGKSVRVSGLPSYVVGSSAIAKLVLGLRDSCDIYKSRL